MTTATARVDEQTELDREDSALHWRRIIALRKAETEAMETVSRLRSEYATAIRDHKKARAELDAALDAEMRPLPLFDGGPPSNRGTACIDKPGHDGPHHTEPPTSDRLRSVEGCACGPDCPASCPCGCHPRPEGAAAAGGKLFPDPPPEPEPAAPPDADAGWRKMPVEDLGPPAHIASTLYQCYISTVGHLTDRLGRGTMIPGLTPTEYAWLRDAVRDARAAPPEPDASHADGRPWPGGLTEGVLRKAYVFTALSKVDRRKPRPAVAHPFEWEGRLWVNVGGDGIHTEVLPLIPAKEFRERYVQYPTSFFPDPAKLDLPADDEGRKQWYTGVVVKVGRTEMAISPAGEARTLVRPEGV